MLRSVPGGWILGGLSINNLSISTSECGPEFHLELAVEMYNVFLVFAAFQMLETVTIALNMPMSSSTPKTILGRLSGRPVWFWYLVMYFSPYDDAAFPMVLECVRLSSSAIFRFFKREDMYFGPLTLSLELLQMVSTFFFECHHPKVLYLSLPRLVQGLVSSIWNLVMVGNRIWRPFKPGTDWVTEGIEKVTVFILVGGVGKYISNGNITIGGKKSKVILELGLNIVMLKFDWQSQR